MNTPIDKDEQFANEAKALFDDSVERLDAATLSKLNRGRQAALAEISTARHSPQWLRWMPAAGVAAAAVLAVIMMQGPAVTEIPDVPDTAATDFEILMDSDSLEMIEELEFYSWLDLAEQESPDNVG